MSEENKAPTDISLSANTIDEKNDVDDIIGTFETSDPNTDDTHSYNLVSGSGDTDDASFSISGNALTAGEEFDFESKASYSIRVQSDDGNGGMLEESFTITINDVNDVPMVSNALSNVLVDEGFGSSEVDLSATFSDQDGDDLTLSTSSSDENVVTVAISGTTLTLTEVGVGIADITVTADDNNGGITSEVFEVTVNSTNNAPTIANEISDQTLDEGFGSSEIDLSTVFEDADGDDLTLSAESSNENVVTVAISENTLTITEVGTGTSIITVTSDDNNGGLVSEEFNVTVNEVNNAPTVADQIDDQVFEEGFGSSNVDLSSIFNDADGDALTLSASSSDESVVSVSISGTSLTITETGTGSSTVTVTADDGNGGSVSDEFTVTVNAANTAPVLATTISDQTFDEGFGSSDVDLSSTFSDADGDDLTLNAESSDENVVTVAISGNTLTITEVGTGTSTITVTANDNNGGSVSEEFTVIVNSTNNAPTFANEINDQILDKGFGSSEIDLSSVFEDADGDDLSMNAESSDETIVTVTILGTTLTLTEAGVGSAVITVTADDGNGGSISDEFTVEVIESPLGFASEPEITVYPNPAQDWVKIKNADEGYSVRIYDLNGVMIIDEYNKSKIDLRGVSKGTYMILIGSNDEILSKQMLIINHQR